MTSFFFKIAILLGLNTSNTISGGPGIDDNYIWTSSIVSVTAIQFGVTVTKKSVKNGSTRTNTTRFIPNSRPVNNFRPSSSDNRISGSLPPLGALTAQHPFLRTVQFDPHSDEVEVIAITRRINGLTVNALTRAGCLEDPSSSESSSEDPWSVKSVTESDKSSNSTSSEIKLPINSLLVNSNRPCSARGPPGPVPPGLLSAREVPDGIEAPCNSPVRKPQHWAEPPQRRLRGRSPDHKGTKLPDISGNGGASGTGRKINYAKKSPFS